MAKLWDDTVPQNQTSVYNAMGRTQANSGPGVFDWIGKKVNSAENAFGTLGSVVADKFMTDTQNRQRNNREFSFTNERNKLAQKYGFRNYDELNKAQEKAEAEGDEGRYDAFWDEYKKLASDNASKATQQAKDYADYRNNSYAGQKINQDRGRFLGSAINTLSTATDVLGLSSNPLTNAIQGGVEGIADELEDNGLAGFNAQNAANRALVGAASGAATGVLNQKLGSNPLIRGQGKIANLANNSVVNGIGRGALSGAVGGAVGGGLSAGLNGGDVLGGAISGAGSGALAGAASGAVMPTINKATGIADLQQSVDRMKQDWANGGDTFRERFMAQDSPVKDTALAASTAVDNLINRRSVPEYTNDIRVQSKIESDPRFKSLLDSKRSVVNSDTLEQLGAKLTNQELDMYTRAKNGEILTREEIQNSPIAKKFKEYTITHQDPIITPKQEKGLAPIDNNTMGRLQKAASDFMSLDENNLSKMKNNGEAVIVMGLPASGKSSNAVDKYIKEGYFNLDNDEVKKLFPEYNNGLGANNVHAASSYVSTNLVLPELTKNKTNVVIPVIGKGTGSLNNYAKVLKDAGYGNIKLVNVVLPTDKTATRNFTRMLETSRNVDMDYIYDEVADKPTRNYNEIKERIKNGTEPNFTDYATISTDVAFGSPAKMLEDSQGTGLQGLDDRSNASGAGSNGRYDQGQESRRVMVHDSDNDVLKTSKEYKYREKANQLLLDQYGTIDTPTARSTKPIETVGKLADIGFTDKQDVEKISNYITGSNGKLNKLTRKVIENAGDIDTMRDFNGMTLDNFIKDRISFESLGDISEGAGKQVYLQINNILKSLPSRKNGTITGTDSAEDVFDKIKLLESKSAELRGIGGKNYRRETTEGDQKAAVLDSVAEMLKDKIFSASDIKKVVTPDVIAELKAYAPDNKKYTAWVDETIAKAKTGADLRSAQKPFVDMMKIIENGKATSGTTGATIANQGKVLFGNTRNRVLGLASAAIDSEKGKKAQYDYYTKKADKLASKNDSNKSSKTTIFDMLTKRNTTDNAEENIGENAMNNNQSNALWNTLGRTSANEIVNNSLEQDRQSRIADDIARNNAIADEVYGRNLPQTDTYSQPVVENNPIRTLEQAMQMAQDNNDAKSWYQLYTMYQDAVKDASNSGTSGTKITNTQQRANAAMEALNELQSMTPDAGYELSNIPLIGNIATLGGNKYQGAAQNLMQQIGYMQSGANIKDDEIKLIRDSYVPQPWDSEQTRQDKLRRARALIQQYQNGYMASEE